MQNWQTEPRRGLPEASPKQGLQLRFPKENYGCNLVLSLSQKVIWTFWEPYTTGPVQSGSVSVLWMGEEQQSDNVDICKANTTIAPVATKRWSLSIAKGIQSKIRKANFFDKYEKKCCCHIYVERNIYSYSLLRSVLFYSVFRISFLLSDNTLNEIHCREI